MKKNTFLLIFVIFCIGSSFAKTQETKALNMLSARPSTEHITPYVLGALVINPPRPHAKFKWLLVVEHTLYPGHTHYLYTDKYHIFQESDGWLWILPEGRYEAYSADREESPRPDAVIQGVFHSVLLSYPEILRHTIFLKSKAPKPLVTNSNVLSNDPKRFMNYWTARAKKIKVNPKKAKVVFKK